ncbi:hypothetical protein KC19_9G105500, partial [Ceratodon purpureus]
NVSVNTPTTRQSTSKPSHSDVRIDHCQLDRRPPNSINRQRSKPAQISKSKFHSPNPEPDHNEFAAHADASVGCSPASTYPSAHVILSFAEMKTLAPEADGEVSGR